MSPTRSGLTRSETLHHQVARNIRNSIEAGVLRDGDVLPSTRELAQQWGVSVFTITEAMKLLAQDGLVVSKSRSNRVVRAPDQTRRAALRLRSPKVLLIGGYPGCGKTELGRILARETGWPLLDKDTFSRPLVETALEVLGGSPHEREFSDLYLNVVRPREYEALMAGALENIECSVSVIVTAPFLREFNNLAWLSRTDAAFVEHNAVSTIVWVHCDDETRHTYIRHRGAARDTAKLTDWPAYLATLDPEFRPLAPHHFIDNSASSPPLQSQAKALLTEVLADE